jgi:sulfatase modifying factor 1
MSSPHSTFRLAVLFLIALAACAPGSTPAVPGTGQPGSPSPEAVNLAGPLMEVGSSWLYADGSLLVPVPAGVFTMGGGKTDNPAHEVNLPDYWIYRTKVTNFQYAYCVAVGQCTPPSGKENPGFIDPLRGNDPVTGVDYSQAAAYCSFAHARLPTEAEWEKMARGTDAQIYPWGDAAPNCELLNFESCQGKTTPVNAYPEGQSPYHAFDTEGNAFEWVADWYKADYYLSSPAENPQGPEKGTARSVRSSAFNSGANQTQTFNRFYSRPADQRANLGFRCVVDDPDYFAPFCNFPATYGTDGVGGAPSGPQSAVQCPDLSIDQSPGCSGNHPITTVVMKASGLWGPPAVLNSPSSCSSSLKGLIFPPGGPPRTGVCSSNGQLSICTSCKVTLSGPPQCPAGYTFVNDSRYVGCLGPARPGECLPGFHTAPPPTPFTSTGDAPIGYTLQAAGQCCELDTGGTLGPRAAATCPAGTFFDGQECIATSVIYPYCKVAGVSLNSCSGGGGGCNITEAGCAATCNPLGYIYDAAACSCTCNAG